MKSALIAAVLALTAVPAAALAATPALAPTDWRTPNPDDIPVIDETIEPVAASLVSCRTVNNQACSAFGQTTTCTIGGSEVALCSCQPNLKWRCASSN